MKRKAPPALEEVVEKHNDLLRMHEEHMDMLEHRRDYELADAKAQVAQFELVLQDKAKLTDAMANLVFKNHSVLRNARMKERARRKYSRDDDNEDYVADETAYLHIQQIAKEHTNYLRRLKGKSASKLSADERIAIEQFIREKTKWIEEVASDAEYIGYVFAAQPIVDEYICESARHQKYLEEESADVRARSIAEASRGPRRITQGNEPLQIDGPGALVVANAVAEPEPVTRGGNIGSYIIQSDAFTRVQELTSQYYELVGLPDPTPAPPPSPRSLDFCKTCHVETIINETEAIRVCPQCGVVERYQDTSMRSVPYGETINAPRSKGSYEKRSYYETWKKMVSGDLNGEIPEEDWLEIFQECMSRRLKFVTREIVRKILRTLKKTHYYKYAPAITNELNNIPLIKFSAEEEATLDAMFEDAVRLFDECPRSIKQRNNFISYSYFFYQACTMAGFLEYRESFPLLCGKDNRKRHDRIWEWMCANKTGEPKWVFYPTA